MPVPRNAVSKARKRQLLSSGMIRKRRVEACVGRGNSGASREESGLRLRESDWVGFGAGWGGAVLMLAKEKFEDEVVLVVLPVLFGGGSLGVVSVAVSLLFWLGTDFLLGWEALSLTMSCSPSNFTPNFESIIVGS